MHLLVCGMLLCGCMPKEAEPVWTDETAQVAESVTFEENTEEESEQECVRSSAIYVHVCGSVRLPGVYELSQDSRMIDAVTAAGGFLEEASKDSINLALPIADGMQIYVPSMEEAQAMPGGTAAFDAGKEDDRININTASVAELCTLPGIGESRAQSIIAYREENGSFLEESQIMNVPGIKDAAYAKIKDKIRVK